MYIPKNFHEKDENNLISMMEKYAFATLVVMTKSGIEANHLPLIVKQFQEKLLLRGHIAKANPWSKNILEGTDVLVIFNGPNCYVSPNYYPTKQVNSRVVPTWNYVSVHAKGQITFTKNDEWKLQMLHELTDKHEAIQAQPWSVNDAPDAYIQKMLPAITGFEIDVSSLEGKWKVSQNQPAINTQGVIDGLSTVDAVHASEMIDAIKSKMVT